jgi:N utilization substance protein B
VRFGSLIAFCYPHCKCEHSTSCAISKPLLAERLPIFFSDGDFSTISFCRRHFAAIMSSMGQRREARERAVQFLFQHDLNPPENLEEALGHFWSSQRAPAIEEEKAGANWGQKVELPPPSTQELGTRLFADKLIRGVLENRPALDKTIQEHAENWDLNRMAVVDRNILRLAIFEMLYRDDIPPIVSINEAVDVAKKYSTQDSGKFVNGILDKIKGELSRPARAVK